MDITGITTALSETITTALSETKVTISWDSVTNAVSYKITEGNSYIKEKTVTATEGAELESCQVTIEPRKQYTFTVSAIVDGTNYTGTADPVMIPETVTGLKTFKDYNGVTLTWTPLTGEGVTGYNIYRNGALLKNISEMTASTAYVDGTAAGTTYNYQIAPVYTGDVEGTKSTAVSGISVRQAFVYISMKTKRTLKAHDGSGAKVTVYKNERIKSYGFTAGKYIFDKNGHKFYVNRTSTKKASYDYTNAYDYSKTEAANFVNHKGISSSTNRLIWVSFYTQQIYLFSGSAGKWTCYDTWKISTGKASSPSPTGMKSIGKKISKRHKLSYWSCFSSLNAFHGVNASSWKKGLGKPKSGGCIRNLTSQAKLIYKTIPKKTRVYCY